MFKKIWKNYKFPIILLFSILFGSIIGIILDEDAVKLKPFGTVFLNLLYTIVVPLVFFTISSSVSRIKNYKKLGKIFTSMFLIFILTSMVSSIFMLLGIKIFNPIDNISITLTSYNQNSFDIGSRIVEMITASDFYLLLSKDNMLPLIIFACIFGFATAKTKEEKISIFLTSMSNIMMKIINIVMYYAPIGLCAYFASLVGEYGSEIIGEYAKGMIFYFIMAISYFLVFYSIYAYIARGKKGVSDFFKYIFESLVTALGTCSSLATLPINLKCSKKLNIDDDVARTTLPIGATMHMEGSSMAAVLKIAFLFSVFGESFVGVDTYLIAILIAVLSGVVMSGIPGGGLIGEMLIVSLYGFPAEAFPIIATIGWIVDSPGTAINATGDIASALLIEKHVKST